MCGCCRDVDLGRMSLCNFFSGSCSLSYWKGRCFLYTLTKVAEPCSVCLLEPVVELIGYLFHFQHCIEDCFLLHQSMFLPMPELSSLCSLLFYILFSLCLDFEQLEREREASNVCHKIHVCLEDCIYLICFHVWKEMLSKDNCYFIAIEKCGE